MIPTGSPWRALVPAASRRDQQARSRSAGEVGRRDWQAHLPRPGEQTLPSQAACQKVLKPGEGSGARAAQGPPRRGSPWQGSPRWGAPRRAAAWKPVLSSWTVGLGFRQQLPKATGWLALMNSPNVEAQSSAGDAGDRENQKRRLSSSHPRPPARRNSTTPVFFLIPSYKRSSGRDLNKCDCQREASANFSGKTKRSAFQAHRPCSCCPGYSALPSWHKAAR